MMTSKRPSLHSLLFIINGISKSSLLRISISPEKKASVPKPWTQTVARDYLDIAHAQERSHVFLSCCFACSDPKEE